MLIPLRRMESIDIGKRIRRRVAVFSKVVRSARKARLATNCQNLRDAKLRLCIQKVDLSHPERLPVGLVPAIQSEISSANSSEPQVILFSTCASSNHGVSSRRFGRFCCWSLFLQLTHLLLHLCLTRLPLLKAHHFVAASQLDPPKDQPCHSCQK